MAFRLISLILSLSLFCQQAGVAYASGELNLANYLSSMRNAVVQPDIFQPPRLRYISYDINNNDFKLLLDKGDAKLNNATQELFNYFLIGLALPNDTFWVNLRPDAPENIIDPLLEKTDIGKIFLEADLQLKKDTASLTSPQNPEGKLYWDKLYNKAGELFGSENITIPTITRPWIVPNEVIVRETEDSAYIYKATLKVMLEADYLIGRGGSQTAPTPDQYAFSDPRLKELNEYSSQIIRETIIPRLTREVNSAKRYAKLRQVYYSLILARWFKQKYSSLGSARASEHQNIGASANSYLSLIDSVNLDNLTSQEPCDKQAYFQAYRKSFKDGEYNLKETVPSPSGQSIRNYISGGLFITSSPMEGVRTTKENPYLKSLILGSQGTVVSSAINGDGKLPEERGNGQMPIVGLTVGRVISEAENAMKVFLSSLEYREVLWELSPQGRKIAPGQMIKDEFAKLAKAKSVPETLEGIESLVRKLNNIKKSYIKSLDADSQGKDGLSRSYTVMVLNLITLLNQAGWGALDATNKSDLPEAPNGVSTGSPLTVEDVGNIKIELRKYAEILAGFYDGLSSVDLTNGVEQWRFGKDYKNYSRDLAGTLNPKELIDGVRTAIRLTIDKRPPDYTVKKWQKILVNLEWIENRIGLTLEKYAAELNELFGDKEEALYKYFPYMEKGELASYRQKYGQPSELKNIATAIEAANTAVFLYKKNNSNIDIIETWKNVAGVLREIDSIIGQWLDNKHKVWSSLSVLKRSIEEWYKGLSDDVREKWLSTIRLEMRDIPLPGLTNIQEYISKYDPVKSILIVIDEYVEKLDEGKINSRADLNAFINERVMVYMLSAIDFHLKRYQSMVGIEELRGIEGLRKEDVDKLNEILKAFRDEMMDVTKVSSALIQGGQESDVFGKTKIDSPGGIDFTDRAMRLKIERVGSFADLRLVLPQVKNAQGLDLDKEFRQIEAIASSGIVPNSRRILELFSACYSLGEFGRRLPQVISCLKSSSAIQESLAIDSDDDFRMCLLLPEIFSDGR